MRIPVVAAAVVLAAAAPAAANPPRDADWTAFGHDARVTNFTPASYTAPRARRLREAWERPLDGRVVAAPLVASPIGGRPTAYVATEAGSVFGLDLSTGDVVWKRQLGSVETIACGSFGVSSTGAIDTTRGLLYVANADGHVYALSLSTGADAPGWPVRVTSRPRTEYVWGGLRISGGRLVVALPSYCDAPDALGVPAEGRIISLDLAAPAQPPLVFDPAPGYGNLAGAWGWGGVAVAPNGDLLTGIGNSEPEPEETQGYAESLVRLSPELDLEQWNRPYAPVGVEDTDLGGAPVLFTPRGCPPLAAVNGKAGVLYVWRRDAIAAGPFLSIPLADGTSAFVGEPAWSPRTQSLYDANVTLLRGTTRLGDGVLALRFGARCTQRKVWSALLGGAFEPPPLVAGDVVFVAGGLGGGYEAHAAASGVRLWSFATQASTLSPLVEARGTVLGADAAGVVRAFRAQP